jgi:hypothetical protein
MAIPYFPHASAARQPQHIWDVIGGASLLQALAGLTALALPIAAWMGWTRLEAVAAASLAIGAGLFIAGLGNLSRYPLMHVTMHGRDWAAIGSGMAIILVGGAAGALLAMLTLKGRANLRFIDAACMIEGIALFLGSGAVAELNTVGRNPSAVDEQLTSTDSNYLNRASIIQAVLGLLAFLLAVVALFMHTFSSTPIILLLAAIICMAPALVISGAALTVKAARERGLR